MQKKKMSASLSVQILILLLITPVVYKQVVLAIGPIECYILGRDTYMIFSIAILALCIVSSIVILKSRLIKSQHIKVAVLWIILTLSGSVMCCLRAPFIIKGAF